MLVSEFTSKYKFKGRDMAIAKKLHVEKDLTENEWSDLLAPDFHFEKSNVDDSKEKETRKPVKEDKNKTSK